MLRWMRIQNVAVIDRLEVDFDPGLNLLTGETGAGKSILIDALGLVLGARAATELVRTGAEHAVVEAGFEISPVPKALGRRLQEAGILLEDELVIRRELTATGRGRVTVNAVAGARQLLREIAPFLADIHGQGEDSSLFRPEAGLDILDRFGGTREDRRNVRDSLKEVRRLAAEVQRVETRAKEKDVRRSELEAIVAEIGKAAPRAGEDDELLNERSLVAHAEKLRALSEEVYRSLYEDDGSALARLSLIFKRIEELSAIDRRFQSYAQERDALLSPLQDLALFTRDYARHIDVTPGRLDQVETRLALLERIKKKFGGTLQAALDLRSRSRAEIEELEGSDERIAELKEALEAAEGRYRALATALSAARRKAAKKLERLLSKELPSLALEKARFGIEVRTLEDGEWRESGLDEVELLFSANPGEEPRPLSKTASGGELSRFVLALKAVSAKGERPKTLVFDEVDSGIGGRVADAVGEKLKELAATHQVICVTHLPQIASFAPAHYRIDKMEKEGRTETRIERLDPEGRVDEIARMLAGAVVTESARKHARELVREKSAD
jgi:DNA repair protein RecN (Recombination protein N)